MDASDIHLTDGTEDPKASTPWISFLLAYAAMLPIVAGAVASLLVGPGVAAALIRLTIIWSGAVLCFLAGVRRGLSFRQPGGPTAAQLGVMMGEFVLATAALLSPWRALALSLLVLGYGSLALLDPAAARRHEAPVYFARLRPTQMLIPVVALIVLLLQSAAL